MANTLLSGTAEHEHDTRKQNINRQTSSHKWTFYNTAISYPFTWILTVLIILVGRKYNSAEYFFRSHKLQSKCLPEGMNIFNVFLAFIVFFVTKTQGTLFFYTTKRSVV